MFEKRSLIAFTRPEMNNAVGEFVGGFTPHHLKALVLVRFNGLSTVSPFA
jgi:hypothetical protein